MLQETTRGTVLRVKVIPKASHSKILGWVNGDLKVRVAAVPEKGAANQEVISLLAEALEIGTSKIEILRGETARLKTICVQASLEYVASKIGSPQ